MKNGGRVNGRNGRSETGGPSAGEGWAVWITGLPGSGKSTVARAVVEGLTRRGFAAVRLSMDERRKQYFPNPDYSAEEREKAYAMFVDEAAFMVRSGKGVVMDGTAPRLEMRRRARRLIPRFAEIFLRCPVGTAMRREAARPEGLVMAGLYEKALRRQKTGEQVAGLGLVPGVDVPFEEDRKAECVIDAGTLSEDEVCSRAVAFVFLWLVDHYGT
ncbi:adenylylsulfate kinase [Desulfovibrio sp. X2]|uniref:adenylyl-sulfate kinase n=1 Tax=Desulfovibrio sp. X2 TaxID=941449 RepID=UPI000358E2F7|nr:adenylyl-sulfate kinase [Desulfovibrio sp. X2]EPR37034.1 adenylylsulfate kinase [Desulfovibrio sp. X2]